MNPDPRECNIKVFSRFRPQSDAEIRAGGQSIVSIQTSDTCVHGVSRHHLTYYNQLKRKILVAIQVMLPSLTISLLLCAFQGRTFTFDRVFKPNTTQERVYVEAAQVIVQGILCDNFCCVGAVEDYNLHRNWTQAS